VAEEGADHAKRFHVTCRLGDSGREATGIGGSRRKAEQAAAASVLEMETKAA
jgi:ribonuclease-3